MEKDYFQSDEFKEILRYYELHQDDDSFVYLDAEDFADIADYYLSTDQMKPAMKVLAMGLYIHPESESLRVVESSLCMIHSKYDEAEEILDKLDSNAPDVKYQRAQIQYTKYLDSENAEKMWREWLLTENREDPQDSERWRENYIHIISSIIELRNYHFTQEERDEGKEIARRWIKEYMEKFQPLGRFDSDIQLADICRENDFADLMCPILVQVLEEQPYLKKGWSNLALAYYVQGEYEQALEACDFALAIEPDDIDALLSKAHTLNAMGEKVASIPYFRKYLFLGGDCVQAVPYAEALFINQENELALDELALLREILLNRRQESRQLWLDTMSEKKEWIQEEEERLMKELEQKKNEKPSSSQTTPQTDEEELPPEEIELRKADNQYSDTVDFCEKVFTDIGDLYYHYGYYDECIDTHSDILQENNSCATSLFMMGLCHMAQKYYDSASSYFASALRNADDQVMMGVDIALSFALNDFGKLALDVLDVIEDVASISKSPFVKNISATRSLAHLKKGDADSFLLHFKTACQDSPSFVKELFGTFFPSDMPVEQWGEYANKEIDVLLKKFKKENLYIPGNS